MELERLLDPPSDRKAAVAVVSSDGAALSFGELAERICEAKEAFGRAKVLVAVEAHRTVEALVVYLAALASGHAVAMLPPTDEKAWGRFCERYRPQFAARIVKGTHAIERLDDRRADDLHPDLALLLSTSGSTGSAKFVRLSRQNIVENAKSIASYLGIVPRDRAALYLPLNYSYGLSVVHSHLLAGASVLLAHGSVRDSHIRERLTRHDCTNFSGVPDMFRMLDEAGFLSDPAPLRFMTVAGGRLDAKLVVRCREAMERRGGEFFVMYGQTEATSRIAYVPPDQLAGNEDRIGIAIPGGALRIADAEGNTIHLPDVAGEIRYRGPNVMMGYAHRREDLAGGPELTELATGDLGTRGADGMFRIVGRIKRMSKIAGLRISHDALEQALEEAGILAAVVGDDHRVLALHTSTKTDDEVRDLVAEASQLPKLTVAARRVDALPRLPSGKVDYEAARSHLSQSGPSGDTNIRALYADTFAPRPVNPRDTFVSLGGDSLSLVQLSLSLEQRLGRLPEGWENLTIAEIERLDPGRSGVTPVGTDVLLRVVAVLMIVVHHATHWTIPGGGATLYLLVGASLLRLHGDALANGQIGRIFRGLPFILLPYFVILGVYTIAWGEVPWASVFLTGNLGYTTPREHGMLPYLYWFVELYVQTLLVVGGLFLVHPVRRFAQQRPFAFALALCGVGLVLRFVLCELWEGMRQLFTLPFNFYLFALGWASAVAAGWREKWAVLGLATVALLMAIYFGNNWTGSWSRYGMQVGVVAVLLFVPRLVLPRAVVLSALAVAAASYHIYLFHRLVPANAPWLLGAGSLGRPTYQFLSIVVGVATGFAAYGLQRWAMRWIRSAKQALSLATANPARTNQVRDLEA